MKPIDIIVLVLVAAVVVTLVIYFWRKRKRVKASGNPCAGCALCGSGKASRGESGGCSGCH